jgi:hypothetical protein
MRMGVKYGQKTTEKAGERVEEKTVHIVVVAQYSHSVFLSN